MLQSKDNFVTNRILNSDIQSKTVEQCIFDQEKKVENKNFLSTQAIHQVSKPKEETVINMHKFGVVILVIYILILQFFLLRRF